jgi:hypothetical protein
MVKFLLPHSVFTKRERRFELKTKLIKKVPQLAINSSDAYKAAPKMITNRCMLVKNRADYKMSRLKNGALRVSRAEMSFTCLIRSICDKSKNKAMQCE